MYLSGQNDFANRFMYRAHISTLFLFPLFGEVKPSLGKDNFDIKF